MFTNKIAINIIGIISRPLVRFVRSTPRNKPIPPSASSTFGLDDEDVEKYVKGLYVGGRKPMPTTSTTTAVTDEKMKLGTPPEAAIVTPTPVVSESLAHHVPHEGSDSDRPKNENRVDSVEDKYSSWFTSSEEKEADNDKDREKVRHAGFGTVRLDTDNPAREDEFDDAPEEYPDYRPELLQKSKSSMYDDMEMEDSRNLDQSRMLPQSGRLQEQQRQQLQQSMARGVKFKMPPVVTKGGQDKEDSPNGTDSKEMAKAAKNKAGKGTRSEKEREDSESDPELKIGAARIPSVYRLTEYSDITHQDMWNLLSKQIIYDNDFLVAINKPPGIPIHSPSKSCRHTMIEFLPELAELTKCEKVYPLHRLDKETTGVLLFAKTEAAATLIKQKFANCEMGKKYLAISKNCPEIEEGSIKIPIAEGEIHRSTSFRSTLRPDLSHYNLKTPQTGAKMGVTHFKVISSSDHCAFLEISPETGIKHQIRVHLGFGIGCPIIGDHKYSHRDKMAPQRLSPAILQKLKVDQSKVRLLPLHLHCSNIKFTMPEGFCTTNVFVHARTPLYFIRTLKCLGLN